MKKVLITILILSPFALAAPMTVETLLKLHRISDLQISPDGKWIAYSVMSPNLEANTKPSQIFVVGIDGGTPKQLTREGSQNSRPRWSPDGKRIAYISNRGGASQVWTMAADGSDAKQVT